MTRHWAQNDVNVQIQKTIQEYGQIDDMLSHEQQI